MTSRHLDVPLGCHYVLENHTAGRLPIKPCGQGVLGNWVLKAFSTGLTLHSMFHWVLRIQKHTPCGLTVTTGHINDSHCDTVRAKIEKLGIYLRQREREGAFSPIWKSENTFCKKWQQKWVFPGWLKVKQKEKWERHCEKKCFQILMGWIVLPKKRSVGVLV